MKHVKPIFALFIAILVMLAIVACMGGTSNTGHNGGLPQSSSNNGNSAPFSQNSKEGDDDPSPPSASGVKTVNTGVVIQFGGSDWLVLEVSDGKALMLSEAIVEERAYHNNWEDTTWEGSDLREYLNGEYYNSFAQEERERIAETLVTNADNPWVGTPGGNDTADKVFLLSLEEVVQYFGDSGQLGNRPFENNYWIMDQYNTVRIARTADSTASWWWLRSPGFDSFSAASVDRDGALFVRGDSVDRDSVGVRPALWLNMES